MPTVVPTLTPTAVPTPAPTLVPIPTPTAEPTRTPVVELSVGLSGIGCDAYGKSEERVVNLALMEELPDGSTIGNHTCTETSRRLGDDKDGAARQLSASISVTMEITLPSNNDDDVAATMVTAQSSGALSSSITAHADDMGASTLGSVYVESISVNTFMPTLAPTAAPTPPPTTVPTPMPTLLTCTNGVADASETDVDCGGGACPPCSVGFACTEGDDCSSFACASDVCVESPTSVSTAVPSAAPAAIPTVTASPTDTSSPTHVGGNGADDGSGSSNGNDNHHGSAITEHDHCQRFSACILIKVVIIVFCVAIIVFVIAMICHKKKEADKKNGELLKQISAEQV